MSLTHDDVRRIAREAVSVDTVVHADDHRWVNSKRVDEAEIRTLRRRLIQSGIFWTLPLALGFLALAVWHEFVARLAALVK